jgi:hypothetical protein
MILYVMEGKIVRRLIEDFLIYFSQDLSIGRQARRDVLAFEKEINGAFQESLEITAINQLRKARHMCRGQNEHVAKLSTSRRVSSSQPIGSG